jgi:hypothetical protein
MRAVSSLVVAFVVVVVGVFALFNCVEWLDAKHVMVIQYPNGTMKTATEPGPFAQWFGTVTKYNRRDQYDFGTKEHPPLRIRFNDGGSAEIYGSISFEMPTSHEALVTIQKEFSGEEAVEQQIVSQAVKAAAYAAGPLMSSTESSGERRNDLLTIINDQAMNGIYSTMTRSEKQKDPVTGQEKTVAVVLVNKDEKGMVVRAQGSLAGKYHINLLPLTVTNIKYDAVVEKQITERQNAITQVQIALANAKKAEQDALTIAKQGEAMAAKAKWDQETIKAQAVTQAEQKRDVARLDKDAAEFYKQKLILEGQGESEKRRLVMTADGALEQKLKAYVEVNSWYADAIKNYGGNWVPTTVMGASAGGTNGAAALIDLFTAKTARDLQLDMSIKK